jgi:uncharacterized protein YprB with RNaseH-like and TPR domain
MVSSVQSDMENLLKKRLALIKSRARELSGAYRGRWLPGLDDPPISLAEAAPGIEHVIGEERLYRVRIEGEAIAGDVPLVTAGFVRMSERETWPLISLIRDPGPDMARRIRNHELCFLDIETTGLSPNTYVFLCGLMYLENRRFVVEQLLARDYAEETGMLLCLRDVLQRYPMVVTFNGAGFDVPFLRTRMAVARIETVTLFEHVDLFEPAREHFAGVLPNCRLETIERHVRGIPRTNDIRGSEIPDAYHEFVRTGNARDMRRVLYHNRMDLLAMVYLVNHLAERLT